MGRYFLLLLLFLIPMNICAQEAIRSLTGETYAIGRSGHISELRGFIPDVGAEDLGKVKGVIKDDNGNVVKNAQVIIYGTFFTRSAKSSKSGNYSIGSMMGQYILEVIAPGYKKYSDEVTIKGEEITNLDIKLERKSNEDTLNWRAYTIVCSSGGVSMRGISNHPAYAGKTLLDVFDDVPLVSINGDKIAVSEESVQMFFNGRENNAPFSAIKNFCKSIDAQDVIEIKVVKPNMANMNVPNLIYITYKE